MKKTIRKQPEKKETDPGKVLKAILFLSITGLIISAYILYVKHSGNAGWCNISTGCHCDTVIHHMRSGIIGIPLALLSLQGYVLIIAVTAILLRRLETEYPAGRKMQIMNMVLGLIGFVYMTYFTYVQAYVIGSWCILHVLLYMLIAAVMILSIAYYIRRTRQKK